MKQLFLTAAFAIVCSIGVAQTTNLANSKTVYGKTLTTIPQNYDGLKLPEALASRSDKAPQRSIVIGQRAWRPDKTVYKDANGNITGITEVEWDERGKPKQSTGFDYDPYPTNIIGGFKRIYDYQDQGLPVLEELYSLNPTTGEWWKVQRLETEYDASNQIVCQQNLIYDESQNITYGVRHVNRTEYTNNGKCVVNGEYRITTDGKFWVTIKEEITVYDSQNQEIEHIYVNFDWEKYINIGSRTTYKYDGNKKYTYYYDWDSRDYYERHPGDEGWIKDRYCIDEYDDNGCEICSTWYNTDGSINSVVEYSYKEITIASMVYPDIYLRGSMNNWESPDEYMGKDMGEGIVEWSNVTIKATDEFKFASDDWETFDWGAPNTDVLLEPNADIDLVYRGGNICLNIEGEEIVCSKIRLDVLKGTVRFEVDKTPSGIASIDDSKSNVSVDGNTIRVDGAKNIGIYNADGKLVGSSASTTAGKGIYIVKADGRTSKVVVK